MTLGGQNMKSMKLKNVRYQIFYVFNSDMLITLNQQELHASERNFLTDLLFTDFMVKRIDYYFRCFIHFLSILIF